MKTAWQTYDVAIVGGGLAGLMAAARMEELGATVVLVDVGVPETPGGLGGFAPFSGAKFSLYPAGRGISPLVGGDAALVERYRSACLLFVALGFSQFDVTDAQLWGEELPSGHGLSHRRYHSVLLSPAEINKLLLALSGRLVRTRVIRRPATSLDVVGSPLRVRLAGGECVSATRIVVAAGRLGANLLEAAAVPQGPGKGIDVGIRLEFNEDSPVAGLRSRGPDAKFMGDDVRTFCLNSPGRIFHYPGLGFSVPGGVVAEAGWRGANVGILCRNPNRRTAIADLCRRASAAGTGPLSQTGRGGDLGWTKSSLDTLGIAVATRIDRFVSQLSESSLIALPDRYVVHYPLLDWYWPVFSLPGRLETGIAGVFAAGDASGHARGLMQAAVMGTLSAEEALS